MLMPHPKPRATGVFLFTPTPIQLFSGSSFSGSSVSGSSVSGSQRNQTYQHIKQDLFGMLAYLWGIRVHLTTAVSLTHGYKPTHGYK